jgi:hypothetical protein
MIAFAPPDFAAPEVSTHARIRKTLFSSFLNEMKPNKTK